MRERYSKRRLHEHTPPAPATLPYPAPSLPPRVPAATSCVALATGALLLVPTIHASDSPLARAKPPFPPPPTSATSPSPPPATEAPASPSPSPFVSPATFRSPHPATQAPASLPQSAQLTDPFSCIARSRTSRSTANIPSSSFFSSKNDRSCPNRFCNTRSWNRVCCFRSRICVTCSSCLKSRSARSSRCRSCSRQK